MDPGTILWLVVAAVVAWLVLDLLLAGGGMTGGMMAGVGGMMSWPMGLVVLVLVLAGLLAFGFGLR
ncbi:MAG: hypothetical protein ACM3ML_36875 [Micromonosporaceae bacterium]